MPLHVVTYHYVRPLKRSRFPALKALEHDDFKSQVSWLDRNFTILDWGTVANALLENQKLPEDALLLTFDDGYADHYQWVLPTLKQHGRSGLFFVVASALQRRGVLDVNKIQFALASVPIAEIAEAIDTYVSLHASDPGFPSIGELRARFAVRGRFDDAPTNYCKRVLQKGLPEPFRAELIDQIFKRFVTGDEAAFAEELYISRDQAAFMLQMGMHLGGHGDRHRWLDSIDASDLRREFASSRALLNDLGVEGPSMSFCYPYGGYNDQVLKAAAEAGFKFGFTVRSGVTNTVGSNFLTLERLDTNEFPPANRSSPNPWLRSKTTTV